MPRTLDQRLIRPVEIESGDLDNRTVVDQVALIKSFRRRRLGVDLDGWFSAGMSGTSGSRGFPRMAVNLASGLDENRSRDQASHPRHRRATVACPWLPCSRTPQRLDPQIANRTLIYFAGFKIATPHSNGKWPSPWAVRWMSLSEAQCVLQNRCREEDRHILLRRLHNMSQPPTAVLLIDYRRATGALR